MDVLKFGKSFKSFDYIKYGNKDKEESELIFRIPLEVSLETF